MWNIRRCMVEQKVSKYDQDLQQIEDARTILNTNI